MISLEEINHLLDILYDLYDNADIFLDDGQHAARDSELAMAASLIENIQEELGEYAKTFPNPAIHGYTYTQLSICLARGKERGTIPFEGQLELLDLLADFAIEQADYMTQMNQVKPKEIASRLRKKVTLPGGEETTDRKKLALVVCLYELKLRDIPRIGTQGTNQAILELMEADGAQCTERQIADVRKWLRKMGTTEALKILRPKPA